MAGSPEAVRQSCGVRGVATLIFVTVGTHTEPFDRLVSRMDHLARETDEPTLMQIGCSKITPSNSEWKRFFTNAEYQAAFKAARVLVCHAGIGTLIQAANEHKPVLCVPRLRAYGEHWDDHQLDICERLACQGRLRYVIDVTKIDLRELNLAIPIPRSDEVSALGRRIANFVLAT